MRCQEDASPMAIHLSLHDTEGFVMLTPAVGGKLLFDSGAVQLAPKDLGLEAVHTIEWCRELLDPQPTAYSDCWLQSAFAADVRKCVLVGKSCFGGL